MSDREYMRADWQGGSHRSPFWATTPGTKAILLGLVAIHFAMVLLRAISPAAWATCWGLLSLDPELVLGRGYLWQIVTGALLHSPHGVTHILFNCLGIFFFGRMIEMRLGLRRYLMFTLAAAVSASIAYLIFAVLGSSVLPMVGASGAVLGLLVLAALWYPQTPVLLFFVLPAPLWAVALLFVALDLLGMMSQDANIAHAAHLGGALYGWLYYRFGGRVRGLFDAVDRMADARQRRKRREQEQSEVEMRRELDRILDKVGREGMPALTDAERKFLKEASERLRH